MTETPRILPTLLRDETDLALLREMADDMAVGLYRRYAPAQAAELIGVSAAELDKLRRAGRIAYLKITDEKIAFLGVQLLHFFVDSVVPKTAATDAMPTQPNESLASPENQTASTPTIDPRAALLSVAETQALLGIGRTKLYELLGDGTLESIKVGRRTLIKRQSVRVVLDQ